jgi:pimeloyl-ACP methyl ester carboxylesterase
MILNHLYNDNGKPLLVMLHGLQSSMETFTPLVPQLEKNFSLLLVDQRGHGQSPPSGNDYTAEAMAGDLKDLLDHLNIKKAIFLGHSMGGRTVLAFGSLYPQMVEKMIIEDMGIHQRVKRSDELDDEKAKLASNAKVTSLKFKTKEEIFEIISPLYSYAKDLLKTKVKTNVDSFELTFWPDVSVMYGYQGNYSDLTPSLTNTDFPVLFLIADPEVGSAMTQQCLDHIKKHVPRAQLQLILKSWHNIHKSDSVAFCDALINFAL